MKGDEPREPPALSDAELRETIDTMGLLVASVSNRVDDQGKILEKLTRTAAETRAAAFAAQRATDWERNGEVVTEQVDRVMDMALGRFSQADRYVESIRVVADQAERALTGLVQFEKRRLDEKEQTWKRRLPFMAMVALVLVIGLGLTLPHFMAGAPIVCNLLGGKSFRDSRNEDALVCGFYEWP